MRSLALLTLTLAPIGAADFAIPSQVKQGEAVRILMSHGGDGYTAELLGKKLALFRQSESTWQAICGIGALEPPGQTQITIRDQEGKVVHTAPLTIANAQYRVRNIRVSPSVSALKPSPGEIERASQLLATVTPERHWTEPLHPPTGDCISSPFGVQSWVNNKPTGSYHRGIDLFSGTGIPVKAVADGYVRIAQMWNMQGGMVGIDHGQGLISTYLHQSKLLVTEGQFVKRGETVGLVGSTGFSTGPHLHWGLAVNGVPINGATWIASMKPCGMSARPAPAKKSTAARKKKTAVKKKV